MLIGIVGCGGFGREIMPEMRAMLDAQNLTAELVFVETVLSTGRVVNGVPVMTEAEFLEEKRSDRFFSIAIANARVRETLDQRLRLGGATPIAMRSARATFLDEVVMGDGAVICAGSVISSNVRIGRQFQCNFLSYVAHDCQIGDFVTFAPNVMCNGNVVIEDHAYIGAGALLKHGQPGKPLRIGRGAVIGMGAVVTKDVPAGETWIGNPARPMQR